MNAQSDLSAILGNQLSQFELSGLDMPAAPSFAELVGAAVSGEIDFSLSGIAEAGFKIFFNELLLNNQLMRQLLIIAVFSALLKCLSDSFKYKSAGELGFYVSYIMMTLLAMSSFHLAAGILSGAAARLSGMMEASVPLVISLLALSGNVSAAVFHPTLFLGINLLGRFISVIFIPLVTAAAALTALNHLMEKPPPLTRLALLLKKGAGWMLNGIVALFALLLTLQKISVPIVNNFALRTARAAANAVPVVGGALNSAMDTVLYVGAAAKSGVMVALVVVIVLAAAAPVLKMLAVMLVFKLAAAVTQPVCDERFVLCVDEIGSFMGQLAGAGALIAVMFVSAAGILLLF